MKKWVVRVRTGDSVLERYVVLDQRFVRIVEAVTFSGTGAEIAAIEFAKDRFEDLVDITWSIE